MHLGAKLKVFFCAALAVVAVLCLVATLADIGALEVNASAQSEYLLRDRGGVVCVYRLPNRRDPVLVSSTQTSSLPPGERTQACAGIHAADYAEALALLEQLGS